MRIVRLGLTNFRNYRQLELRLPPRLVVIQGDNAQGKTNLLEAIHMLATTKSHRASSDRDLIHQAATREDLSFARISADVQRERGNLSIDIVLRLEKAEPSTTKDTTSPSAIPLRKRIRVNDIVRRAIDLVGQVNVVTFSAQDIDLVAGTPSLCRRYLDLVNSQTDSNYLRSLQRYNRVLLQRNHLLKLLQERQAQPDQLQFWDKELVGNGSYIVMQRRCLVTALNKLAQEIHNELSGKTEKLEIVYLPSIDKDESLVEIESRFRQALYQTRRKEIAAGMTLVGPHRDSLQFQVNEADMSRYGSRGQQQTVILSLKLAEARYIQTKVGDSPILLLDDVFSELDHHRRQHLLESIVSFQQVLISVVDLDCFEPSFLAQTTQFRVRQGTIESS